MCTAFVLNTNQGNILTVNLPLAVQVKAESDNKTEPKRLVQSERSSDNRANKITRNFYRIRGKMTQRLPQNTELAYEHMRQTKLSILICKKQLSNTKHLLEKSKCSLLEHRGDCHWPITEQHESPAGFI